MDRGGTFTDVLRVDGDGFVGVQKVLSDEADIGHLARGTTDLRRGTTVATNALLERNGCPALLVTNRGFGDLREIRDQRREDLFDGTAHRRPPLGVGVVEVSGRIASDGRVVESAVIDESDFIPWLHKGVKSVAVVFIHGPLAPQEEIRVANQLRDMGFSHVSLGHKISASVGYVERMQTTLADAVLTPLLPRVAGLYMKSDGGLAPAESADWRGANAVLSGPAGGAVATQQVAKSFGITAAFGIDVGGTSADVCHVNNGVRRRQRMRIDGWTLRVPSVEIKTVAAGGGSILTSKDGIFQVGPASAGANPGPAAYGRGGPPTVTDCEVVLGLLPRFPSVCGANRDQPLDVEASRCAIQRLDPQRSVEQIACDFQQIAAENMANAILQHAAAMGVDPTEYALVAFGGAGPAHGCRIASRIGITQVIVPFLASCLSAFGIGQASLRAERIVAIVDDNIDEAYRLVNQRLPWKGKRSFFLQMQYKGTGTTLQIPFSPPFHRAKMVSAFVEAHRRQFGFARSTAKVVFVSLQGVVEKSSVEQQMTFPVVADSPRLVRAYFDGVFKQVRVLPYQEVDNHQGPLLVLLPGSTVVIPSGWRVQVGEQGLLLCDISAEKSTIGKAFHPAQTAIFAGQVMSIAEQMGELLARLARSVSIRERRDFSCAIFDRFGNLVANAPHVPVHLGSMGECVRVLLNSKSPTEGTVWASNDPYAGGSHLPDITVMMPVFFAGERVGFVACRGHHIDVGGSHPGSMPPNATSIEEEGIRLQMICLIKDGKFYPPNVDESRQPEDVIADLEAQVASCFMGQRKIHDLLSNIGAEAFCAQLEHLQSHAERVAKRWLQENQGTYEAKEVLDDGLEIFCRISISGSNGELRIDAPRHQGNLNAPFGVLRAALLYVMRSRFADPIPLNDGILRPWCLTTTPDGLCSPAFPVAVAGGNVETSQRLVDVMLRALQVQASSQGTMNNLTVGTSVGAWYETIGGGAGAGIARSGGGAVQVHMTNTRATDVEELEVRFPVRLLRWCIRRGSGGVGQFSGGNGMVKEWLFLDSAQVSLLANRRLVAAAGLAGGAPGALGVDERDIGNGWEKMPLTWQAKAGDLLRISTPGGGGVGSCQHSLKVDTK